VPLVKVKITEHRMHKRACSCGTVTATAAPGGVDGPVCYGSNLHDRIRGCISTVCKHGDNILTALRDAITKNPWQPPQHLRAT